MRQGCLHVMRHRAWMGGHSSLELVAFQFNVQSLLQGSCWGGIALFRAACRLITNAAVSRQPLAKKLQRDVVKLGQPLHKTLEGGAEGNECLMMVFPSSHLEQYCSKQLSSTAALHPVAQVIMLACELVDNEHIAL